MSLIRVANSKSTQSIMGISLLVKLLKNYDVDPSLLLQQAGIEQQLLNDPKAQISFQQEYYFTQLLTQKIKDASARCSHCFWSYWFRCHS